MNIAKNSLILLTLLGSIALSACENNDGAFEEAGEQVDRSVENTKDAVEDAGDEIEDATDQ